MIAHNVTPIATMMAKQTAGEYGSIAGASRFLSASALSTDNVSGALRVAAWVRNGLSQPSYQTPSRADALQWLRLSTFRSFIPSFETGINGSNAAFSAPLPPGQDFALPQHAGPTYI
jgi:hypothetical protein